MTEDTFDNEETNKVKEASTSYKGSNRIHFFSSFSESNEAQYQHWAELTPEDRLSEFFSVMSRFYVRTQPEWKGTKIHLRK